MEQNSNKSKIKQGPTQRAWSFIHRKQILRASSFTSTILVLLESRASDETENPNKVPESPEWLFITFTKDGCLA